MLRGFWVLGYSKRIAQAIEVKDLVFVFIQQEALRQVKAEQLMLM